MNLLADFHFLRPAALLLLLALPLLWLAARRRRRGAGAWQGVVDAHLLPHLLERGTDAGRGAWLLAGLVWALGVLALAGPAWEREPVPLYHNQAARVLALELAPSMLAEDIKPSRLARARYKIDDILARSRDYQTALVAYAGDAFVVAPLTSDVATVQNLVGMLDPGTMPVAGNATARAIEQAARLIDQAGLRQGEILLLADGAGAGAEAAARKARAQGIRVSVLAVGSGQGAPVPLARGGFMLDDNGKLLVARRDSAALRALAAAGGGRYAELSADARDLDALLGNQVDPAGDGSATDGAPGTRWRDRGPWLLLALLPLALLGFRRGWLMAFALVVVLPPSTAHAAGLADLWQRPDQQAAAALAAGDAARAAALARSPQWRASAHYRAGDYAAAASAWAEVSGPDAAYNRGNALAQQGQYEQAIAAYDEALREAPDMADAQANRALVEAALRQQQAQADQADPQDGHDQQQGESGTPPPQSGASPAAADQAQPQQGEQAEAGEPNAGGQRQSEAPGDATSQAGTGQSGPAHEPPDAGSAADAATPDAEQQEALSRAIDESLAQAADGTPSARQEAPGATDATAQASPADTAVDEAAREKQQVLDQLLQRVPDDPGGLLRRKFQLEYERRQQGRSE